MLHGIGRFVSDSGHHKHAAYLIRNTPLDGWSADERVLVAQIARYYRKAMPKPAHLEYAALAAEDRRRVDVLASLLRIADGLDIRHLGVVTDVAAVPEGGLVVIHAQADGDASRELDAAMEKADLFERTFGARVILRQAQDRQAQERGADVTAATAAKKKSCSSTTRRRSCTRCATTWRRTATP